MQIGIHALPLDAGVIKPAALPLSDFLIKNKVESAQTEESYETRPGRRSFPPSEVILRGLRFPPFSCFVAFFSLFPLTLSHFSPPHFSTPCSPSTLFVWSSHRRYVFLPPYSPSHCLKVLAFPSHTFPLENKKRRETRKNMQDKSK